MRSEDPLDARNASLHFVKYRSEVVRVILFQMVKDCRQVFTCVVQKIRILNC